jgi:hypothetical protein
MKINVLEITFNILFFRHFSIIASFIFGKHAILPSSRNWVTALLYHSVTVAVLSEASSGSFKSQLHDNSPLLCIQLNHD